MIRSARFWTVIALLLIAVGLIEHRGNLDRVPPSDPLTEFPMTVGPLVATNLPLDQETLDVLGKGDFLNRSYTLPAGLRDASVQVPATGALSTAPLYTSNEPITLFIGYFPTQRSGQSIHSPQNCLPGAGWSFDSSGTVDVPTTDGKPMRVGEYLISNGGNHAEVLYWYQSHSRSIANDYKAKALMLADAIRLNRTDAALVRIVTLVRPNESRSSARARVLSFAAQIAPDLPRFIPN